MRTPLVIHPILIAVYPILFLYANNLSEMSAKQIFILLAASVGLALVLWALFGLLLKDRAKAGLATSILVFLLLTYGHFYGVLRKWDVFVPGHQYLLPGALLAFGYCVYFIRRARRDFATTTVVLNAAAAAMVAINLFTIANYQVTVAQRPPAVQPSTPAPPVVREVSNLPDIYFIILDEYAHPDIIKEQFGGDNEAFVKSLEKRGFYVARNSTMRNEETIRVIASILNMEFTPETEPPEISYERITSNKVVDHLRSLGYRYVYFGQWYEQDRYEVKADVYINYYEMTGPLTAEFSATLWDTTILSPFYDSLVADHYEGFYRQGVIRTLDHLGRIPDTEQSPKFVFAHIMVPHTPFVFGPNGERVEPANFYNFDDKKYYLGQYMYITREIDKALDKLLKKSAIEPIIILQSDHGARWLEGWEKILNAYYLPGNGKDRLNDSISPVNTFRVIFNQYFKGDYELLKDIER